MKRRVPFDGTNQSNALRGLLSWSQRSLRTKSGKTLKDLAVELSMAPATLARYLNGTTPLGSEQFGPFAEAFETTEAALLAACFPVITAVDANTPWTMRNALRGHVPEVLIDQYVEEWSNAPIADQQSACIDIILMHQAAAREASERMLKQQPRRDRLA